MDSQQLKKNLFVYSSLFYILRGSYRPISNFHRKKGKFNYHNCTKYKEFKHCPMKIHQAVPKKSYNKVKILEILYLCRLTFKKISNLFMIDIVLIHR